MGYHVEHMARDRREGGGMAAFIPQQVWVLATSSMELYIQTAIATKGEKALHLINTYIPPYPAPAYA